MHFITIGVTKNETSYNHDLNTVVYNKLVLLQWSQNVKGLI